MPDTGGSAHKGRGSLESRACDMWPGITTGLDARCTSCCWAELDGVYQVKVRDAACVNHGGPLASALARAARWRQGVS